MLSQGATPLDWPVVLGKGENIGLVGDCAGCGIELQGQASPRETPLMAVRDGGQIGARPLIKTFQSTGMGTIMTLEACVAGCERIWPAFWGQKKRRREAFGRETYQACCLADHLRQRTPCSPLPSRDG